MPEVRLSDLKITKMTSEGWITAPLSESPFYECMRIIHEEQDGIKARNVFIDYMKDMFLYDTRDGKICEISWSRFLGLYQLIEAEGLIQPDRNELRIDSNMVIHDGQHRLAIWYAMGNEYIYIDDFWNPEE